MSNSEQVLTLCTLLTGLMIFSPLLLKKTPELLKATIILVGLAASAVGMVVALDNAFT